MLRPALLSALVALFVACQTPTAPGPPPAPDHEALLAEARTGWEASGEEADAIWVGRRLAYLGRHDEAVEWYTQRLRDFPDSYRLRRHRGHRWLTLREPVRAEVDLAEAWELARRRSDAVEPDGLPNARGIPTSTDHSNILYHLALSFYVQGRFDQARLTWARCHRVAALGAVGDDMEVAAAYWHHVASARCADLDGSLAEDDLAATVAPDLEIIENHAYHQLCLLLTGRGDAEELGADQEDGIQDATRLYGLARWHAEQGRDAEHGALLRRIVAETPKSAFGHLAAEADLAR